MAARNEIEKGKSFGFPSPCGNPNRIGFCSPQNLWDENDGYGKDEKEWFTENQRDRAGIQHRALFCPLS